MVAYFYVVLGLRFLGERTPNFGIRDKAIPRGVRVLSAEISLIAELEDALKVGSWEKRGEILKRVTDQFLNDADRLNEQQIRVFDDVLVHLIQRIETKALVQLSTTLAPVANAPIEVIRRLAKNEEIAVAGSVLAQSNRMTEDDLIHISKTGSQGHLLAISGRSSLNEAVTDVLVRRGDRQVTHKLVRNSGARFSETGFAMLVKSATTDESLVERLGLRLDIPLQLLRELLLRATDAVRSRLLALAPPEAQEHIQRALANGLAFRPFAETVRDTWSWLREGWGAETSVRENRKLRISGGMSAEREATILGASRSSD